MESPRRTIAKAVSWQTLGLFSMAVIGFLFTGSVQAAGSMAIVTTACGAVSYVLHERVWNRITWGRTDPLQAPWHSPPRQSNC